MSCFWVVVDHSDVARAKQAVSETLPALSSEGEPLAWLAERARCNTTLAMDRVGQYSDAL
ncbi:hypothetical protein SAMD00023353_6700130 [Rosellinia necatrix]|uniref:Uncharacterized protein n=1 Tax=Rosellinia necatrix TaxID=77044 RepID=A0A1S8AAG5_ROSNE|nr:hypothetical protein SAMD00023353_6700130 [Rosellinia necatrix]